jgi:hypothetical protein
MSDVYEVMQEALDALEHTGLKWPNIVEACLI